MPPVAAVWSLLPLLLLAALGSAPVAGDITVTLGQYSCSGGGESHNRPEHLCVYEVWSQGAFGRAHFRGQASYRRWQLMWCAALCGAAPRDITDSIGTEMGGDME